MCFGTEKECLIPHADFKSSIYTAILSRGVKLQQCVLCAVDESKRLVSWKSFLGGWECI